MTNVSKIELVSALMAARNAADGGSNDEEIEAWQEVGDLVEDLLSGGVIL